MLTDVQIAQSAKMEPIKEIAAKVGLSEDDLELYGKYKAKISLETIERLKDKKDDTNYQYQEWKRGYHYRGYRHE